MKIGQMQHMNSNQLCVIDVETTGLRPGYHDIIEICILPLDSELRPLNSIPPFNLQMKPGRPQNIDSSALKINKIKLADLTTEPETALGVFKKWFDKFITGNGRKKIAPLAHNWSFDRSFIMDWMGYYDGTPLMDDYIDYRVRDTSTVAHYLNDLCYMHSVPFLFPKQGLAYMCSQLNIERHNAHTALGDCIDTAKVYKRLMTLGVGMNHVKVL